ncbi:four helix bundle protein [soil metagenome]
MRIRRFEDVLSWQKAVDLYASLHEDFEGSREYFFRDQTLRAALSISNNIAEGFDRSTNKDFRHFLVIARGSAAEVRSMLIIPKKITLLPSEKSQKYHEDVTTISKLSTGFIKSLDSMTQITNNRKHSTKS